MSRFETVMALVGRGSRGLFAGACTVCGCAALMLAPQVAFATTVPEIDPASMGSVLGVVVGVLALAEGRSRRRRDR